MGLAMRSVLYGKIGKIIQKEAMKEYESIFGTEAERKKRYDLYAKK
jgi:hypothetical protein